MEYIKENFQKIVIVAITAALIFAAYFLFTPNKDEVILDIAQENRAEVNRTIQILREVREITINKEIFTNTIFTSLQDTKVILPKYDIGKANPFKPIATSTLPIEQNIGVTNGPPTDPGEIQEFYIN